MIDADVQLEEHEWVGSGALVLSFGVRIGLANLAVRFGQLLPWAPVARFVDVPARRATKGH